MINTPTYVPNIPASSDSSALQGPARVRELCGTRNFSFSLEGL